MKDFDTLCKQIKTEHGKAKYQTAEQEVFPRVCQLDQVVANTEAEFTEGNRRVSNNAPSITEEVAFEEEV